MKKIALVLLAAIALGACSNHGKKVEIEGTKGEVYYKGDGVSEADAKKLGSYLKEQGYFDNNTSKTVQLVKAKDGGYDLHFVVDEKKIKETPGTEDKFVMFGAMISKNVFNNEPVNIYFSDTHLKDFKTLAFDKKKAEELLNPSEPVTDINTADTKGWDHDTMGGVTFYWKGLPDDESKTIAEYIVKNGAFAGGTANLYMTKEGEHYVIRFPMIASARTDPAYMETLDKVTKEIKDNVFANVPFTFIVTDENMATVKSWDY